MLVVGVDENGLGPLLGPLVGTAVALEVVRYDRRRLSGLGRRAGIDDSKETSAFGHMASAESVSLALIERTTGRVPSSVDDVYRELSLDGLLSLRAPCPTRSAPQCWGPSMPLPCFGGDLAAGHAILDRLLRGGVRPCRVRSAIACVRVYNELTTRHESKLVVDLLLFERLLCDMQGAFDRQLEAICGMVGGIRKYTNYFQVVDREGIEVLAESARCARYRIPRVGEVTFEVDADARHLPVSLASMVGKYVRELAMERQNRFYARHDATLPRASGYRDPITHRFVAESAPLRRRLRVSDECFERRV